MRPSARPAYWRGLTTFDPQSGTAVLSFNSYDGDVVRLQLNLHDLEAVHDVVGDLLTQSAGTKVHSEKSYGIPRPSVSPQDGVNVCPPATSSTACSGEAYEPKSSSSDQGCHLPSRLWRKVKSPFRVRNAYRPDIRFAIDGRILDGEAPRRVPQRNGGDAEARA